MLSKVQKLKAKGKRQKDLQTKIYFFLFTCFFFLEGNAQCAMCRASLQNEANKAVAEGVNDGIVYLMAIPYILVAGVFFAVWRLKQMKKEVKA
jgi:hypothetical protein